MLTRVSAEALPAIVQTHMREAAYPDGTFIAPMYCPGEAVQYVQVAPPHVTDAGAAGVGTRQELAFAGEYQYAGHEVHDDAPPLEYQPAAHAAQAVARAAVAYEPAAQDSHSTAFDPANWPGKQAAHTVLARVEYAPAEHTAHSDAPARAEYEPASQGAHAAAPAPATKPGAQNSHALALAEYDPARQDVHGVLPDTFLYFPDAHRTQAIALAGFPEKPTSQTQTGLEAAELELPGQSVHVVAPTSESEPAPHDAHAAAAYVA